MQRPVRWRWPVAGILVLVLVTAGCGRAQQAAGATPPPTPTARPVVVTAPPSPTRSAGVVILAPTPTAIAPRPAARPVAPPTVAPTVLPPTPTPPIVATSSSAQTASVTYLPPSAALTAGAIFMLTPHPTPTASPVPTATVVGAQVSFATVQQLLTGYCSGCHPPNQGMNLLAGQVYANIVNVRSQEDPALMRVRPGDPASSYLYLKVSESRPPVGGQMPLEGSPLTNDQLTTLRVWIQQGATGQ